MKKNEKQYVKYFMKPFQVILNINNFFKIRFRCQRLIVFIGLYFIATFLIIPVTAPIFGREKVKHTDMIKPATYMTVVLNRNYVRPALNNLLAEASKEIQGTNIQIAYLDANFPFINKFPLLPHLSHNDGKKIDLSFIYEDQNGKLSTKQKSMSGYGVFENPKPNELNQVKNCLNRGFFQYDYPKYFTFGTINSDLLFSEKGTKKLIKAILKSPQLGKIFIEPHIKQRLGLRNRKIRYQGSRSVRHDDHIHLQLKYYDYKRLCIEKKEREKIPFPFLPACL